MGKLCGVMEQWSPDGKWLVYFDWKHLFLVSSDGGPPQKLTPDRRIRIAPTWFSNGKAIAFSYFPLPDALPRIEAIDLASRLHCIGRNEMDSSSH